MREQIKRIIKPNGAIVLFGSEPFSSYLRCSNIRDFRYDIIWEKERPTNILFMKSQIAKVHEIISVFYTNQPTYNPQMEKSMGVKNGKQNIGNTSKTQESQKFKYSKDYNAEVRYPRSIKKFNRDRKATHPTQKPVALIEYLIKTYTNE
jgi:DNA modification methylase